MAFSEGFARGFGLMDAYYSREDQKKRADRQEALTTESHNLNMQVGRAGLKDADTNREWLAKERERKTGDWKYQDELREDAKEDRDYTEKRRPVEDQQKDEISALNISNAKSTAAALSEQRARERRKDLELQANESYKNLATDMVTDANIDFWKKNPQYDPLNITGFDTGHVVDVLSDVANPNSDTNMNDPQVLQAANIMFYSDLNKGSEGKKRIVKAYAGKQPGTLVFELGVTGNDGKEITAPMTVGRDANPKAEVMQVKVTDLLDRVQGTQFLREALQSPELAPKLGKLRTRYATTNDAKLDPRIAAQVKYLEGVITNSTEEYKALQANTMGSVDPKELTRIQNNITQAKAQVQSLLGLPEQQQEQGFDLASLPRPQTLEDAVSTIVEYNKSQGRNVTPEAAMQLARQEYPDLPSATQAAPQQATATVPAEAGISKVAQPAQTVAPEQAGLQSVSPVQQQIIDSQQPGVVSQAATGIRDAVHGAAEDYRSKQPTMERDRAVKNFFTWIKAGSRILPTKGETEAVLHHLETLPPEEQKKVMEMAEHYGLLK